MFGRVYFCVGVVVVLCVGVLIYWYGFVSNRVSCVLRDLFCVFLCVLVCII